MKLHRLEGLGLGALAGAIVVTALVYERLPDPMATHFDFHGNPNGWMSRPWGVSVIPLTAIVVWAVTRAVPRLLPRRQTSGVSEGANAIVRASTLGFLAAIQCVLLGHALLPSMSVMRWVFVLMGVLWITLGLVLPRVKRNAVMGIRTPWALSSDENWARTQRFGGYVMFAAGLVVFGCGLVAGPVASGLAFVAIGASAVVPFVYSLLHARREDRGGARPPW